jgi:hypothetical protein
MNEDSCRFTQKKGRNHQSKYIDFFSSSPGLFCPQMMAEVFYHNKNPKPKRKIPQIDMRKAKPHTSLQTIYISLQGHYINGTRARKKYFYLK